MLSNDVYKTRHRTTVASIEAWLAKLRGVAEIETAANDGSWRLAVQPKVAEACPFELVLRSDQHFDLSVGPETYEDQPIDGLELFEPLLAAIARGDIVTRTWSTLATETPVKIETIVRGDGGSIPWPWSKSRLLLPVLGMHADHWIASDHHYAPYARGA